MSNIDKQALRTAAENATPGEWCTDDHHGVIADSGLNGNYYIASCSGPEHRANKRFIAAANPDTVLALLDELEAVQTVSAARLVAIDTTHKMFQRERDRAEKAEKRIAELEAHQPTAAATDVMAERQRQQSAEGWTSEHDDEHVEGQLSDAAACYALFATDQRRPVPAHWPWSGDWWKQCGQRRDLVRAGALILAEIERLDRASGISIKGSE